MRKLLLFFAMLCVSVGAWAAPGDPYEVEYNFATSAETESVLKVKISGAGYLAQAIAVAQNSGNSFQYFLLETEPNQTVTLSDADIAALNGLNVSTIFGRLHVGQFQCKLHYPSLRFDEGAGEGCRRSP